MALSTLFLDVNLAKYVEITLSLIGSLNSSSYLSSISDDQVLLESGLDSLGFAILVALLDEELGFDPFQLTDEPVYPTTFGEFVAIYESNKKQ